MLVGFELFFLKFKLVPVVVDKFKLILSTIGVDYISKLSYEYCFPFYFQREVVCGSSLDSGPLVGEFEVQ